MRDLPLSFVTISQPEEIRMSRLKVSVLNPVTILFTELFSNGFHLVAVIGIAAALLGGTAFLAARWAL